MARTPETIDTVYIPPSGAGVPPEWGDAAPATGGSSPELSARVRRGALAIIMALAGFLNFFNLWREGYANSYYAAAIKSMIENWHNFFFVSFDPGGFVTVDKPPLGFWIQAASAKLFGFSGFSILLPEALAGTLSVGLLYLIVRRWFGSVAGLLAALALALTPISVVTNRNNTIDSLLVLTTLAAAWAVLRAAERGSFRWLALTALLVGLGFNIKMLEAYLVVPALVAVYLFTAALPWRTRILHLLGAGAILLAVSLAWVVAVDLTPVASRPYVGSSSTNSELELALGYNGIERLLGPFFGRATSSAATSAFAGGAGGAGGGPGGVSENGPEGVFRLFNTQLGGQISWLLPLGLIGLLASGWSVNLYQFARELPMRLREWRADPAARRAAHLTMRQASWVLWGLWTITMGVFFSVAGFFHTYYLSMLAPGVAALAGIGAIELWADYRRSDWRGWLLPIALVVTGAVQAIMLASFPTYATWLTPLALGVSLIAAALLIWNRLRPDVSAFSFRRALASLSLVGALAALLLAPTVWIGVSLTSASASPLPHAGPVASVSAGGGAGARAFGARGAFGGPNAGGPPFGAAGVNGPLGAPPEGLGAFNGDFTGAPGGAAGARPGAGGFGAASVSSALVSYLEAHQGGAKYLLATLSANEAAPFILATGKPVMALGGFLGSDPILTLSQLQAMVRDGQVRYFLISGRGGGPGGSGNSDLTQWVTSACSTVSASAYGSASTGVSGGFGGGGQLYDCSTAGV